MTIGVIVVQGLSSAWRKLGLKKQKETCATCVINNNNKKRRICNQDISLKMICLQQQDMSQNTVNPLITQSKHCWLESLITSVKHKRLCGLAFNARQPPDALTGIFDRVCRFNLRRKSTRRAFIVPLEDNGENCVWLGIKLRSISRQKASLMNAYVHSSRVIPPSKGDDGDVLSKLASTLALCIFLLLVSLCCHRRGNYILWFWCSFTN